MVKNILFCFIITLSSMPGVFIEDRNEKKCLHFSMLKGPFEQIGVREG
jgi:hypothetical protein